MQTQTEKNGALATVPQQAPAAATDLYSREQIDTIKKTVAKGASDVELALFLEICRSRELDPFTRQVYYVPGVGVITAIDGLRAIADRTGRYIPGPTRYETQGERLVAAFVTVRKYVRGGWHDIEESAYLSEYLGTSPIWKSKPRVMLAKCAEARALRRAFPAQLSGVYEQSEIDAAGEREVNARPATPVEATIAPKPARRAKVEPLPIEVPALAAKPAAAPDPDDDGRDGESVVYRAEIAALLAEYAAATKIVDCPNAKVRVLNGEGKLSPPEYEAIVAAKEAAYARIKAAEAGA